jgi:hypothetical protein
MVTNNADFENGSRDSFDASAQQLRSLIKRAAGCGYEHPYDTGINAVSENAPPCPRYEQEGRKGS